MTNKDASQQGEEIRPSTFKPATCWDFKNIQSRCLASGQLYEDPEFPATDHSIYYKNAPDIPITWRSPTEICEDPQLFVEGISRFDVQQGMVGDCWVLAAVANLAMHKKLFYKVVPDDQNFGEDYAGVFHFRFWQYGRWVEVIIDDQLPTYNGELVYLHSPIKNEFWSALLEKAYAKLYGSYEAIDGGSTGESLEDFTGGLAEMFPKADMQPDFFNVLLKAYERNSLTTCEIWQGLDDGGGREAITPQCLVKGHAYSVTGVQCVTYMQTPGRDGKIPLVRVRNPWGNQVEWNGAFGDNSPEWHYVPESEKEKLSLIRQDDGEYWMRFEDVIKNYSCVQICHLNPDSLDPEDCPEGCTKKWETSNFEGEWVQGKTAGGCRNYPESFWSNPRYQITLKEVDEDDEGNKCTVIVALMQKNGRSQRRRGVESHSIGFELFRWPEETVAGGVKEFTYHREVTAS